MSDPTKPSSSDDRIEVNIAPVDSVGGAQPEPEERPARRVIPLDNAAVRQAQSPDHPGINVAPLHIRAEAVVEDTVATFADVMGRQCGNCKYFDQAKWRAHYERLKHSLDPIDQGDLNAVRAELLGSRNAKLAAQHPGADGDLDVEHVMGTIGFCQAYSSIFNDVVFVLPIGSCPDVEGLEPQFEPASAEARKAAAAKRDAVLMAARDRK